MTSYDKSVVLWRAQADSFQLCDGEMHQIKEVSQHGDSDINISGKLRSGSRIIL